MHVDHLNAGELRQDAAGGQARRETMQAPGERDLKTIGEEGDEDVRLDPRLTLMKDRTNGQIALQGLERLLHRDELNVILPEKRGIALGQIGAQQIAALAASDGSQLAAIESERQRAGLLVDLRVDQTPGGRRLRARGA